MAYVLTDKDGDLVHIFTSLHKAVDGAILEAKKFDADWIIDYMPESVFDHHGKRPTGCEVRMRRTFELVATVKQYEMR